MTWNEFKDEIDSMIPNGDFNVKLINVTNPSPHDPIKKESIVLDFDERTNDLLIFQ